MNYIFIPILKYISLFILWFLGIYITLFAMCFYAHVNESNIIANRADDLLGKFSELESRLGGMDEIISKMDELEKEVIQRNPTPVEKLNMRSMESFPYSVKLTDFWEDREGYDTGGEEVEKEYTLTQDEVDYDYNETDIRNTFKPKKD